MRDRLRALWRALDQDQRSLVLMFAIGAVVGTFWKIVTADRWW